MYLDSNFLSEAVCLLHSALLFLKPSHIAIYLLAKKWVWKGPHMSHI